MLEVVCQGRFFIKDSQNSEILSFVGHGLTPTFCQALKQREYLVSTCVHVCGGVCMGAIKQKIYIPTEVVFYFS